MKLERPFIRLPLRFDVERLRLEMEALPRSAWAKHPTGYAGNSAARLISVNGGENDSMVGGPMLPTPHLQRSPYIQQVLGTFGTVWSRSRLMKLAPGAQVPAHVDINYHWYHRVRVHIPIQTRPEVRFHCGDEVVHMAAGEAWIFDNWRVHRVDNASPDERVHLVADTTGSAAFWQLVANAGSVDQFVPFRADARTSLPTEKHNIYRVLPPAEVDELLGDLDRELHASAESEHALRAFRRFLNSFRSEWRQLWSVYADGDVGLEQYQRMLEVARQQGRQLASGLYIRSNRQPAGDVLAARLSYAVNPEHVGLGTPSESARGAGITAGGRRAPRKAVEHFDRPIFVVAAPRSGSTLLFETLACTPQLWTVGGEAHWLVEGVPSLRPGAPGIESNRLRSEHLTPELQESMPQRILQRLQNVAGKPWADDDPSPLRFLEKTPKNALRIPFFDRIFPDALYVHLWRDPRENISSIIEAWKSGRWITYQALPQWDGPWSLLLPPGWRELRGKNLAEIAAYQWEITNRIILDDLSVLPAERSLAVRYADLVENPAQVIDAICRFAGLEFDSAFAERASSSLPLSKFTLTAPRADKWRTNANLIMPVLPGLTETWSRLAGRIPVGL